MFFIMEMIAKNMENYNVKSFIESDEGVFEGYASVFNVVDYAGDIVLPGAFSENLKPGIKVLWQHDYKQPIGVVDEAYEDDVGLFVKGRVFLNLMQGREAYFLMRNKVTDHLSIGYQVVDYYHEGNVRYIKKLDLWEVSVVTFPANRHASIICLNELKKLDGMLYKAKWALDQCMMVGDRGLEPLTSAMSTQRSSQLS